MALGRSVRLYLVDGTASGIITAEIINWTGHVLAAPRTRLEAVIGREELKRTGVYLLFGADEEGSELPRVYVGEGDEIGKRLYAHNRDESKQFWERFIAITNKDLNLTKAHVRYLEGKLIERLKAAKKVKLANSDNPTFDKLPEADIADMDTFLGEIELVLPVVGVDFLRKPRKVTDRDRVGAVSTDAQASPASFHNDRAVADALQARMDESDAVFVLQNTKAGIKARAMEIEGEFVILQGSIGSLKERTSFHERIKSLRDAAFESGRIIAVGSGNFELVEDIALSSPSAGAVFLFGTSRNGRTDWIEEKTGLAYGAWKEYLISSSASVSAAD